MFQKMKKVKNKNVGDTVTDDGYIDKTEVLEKGIRISPSIFLEGAAASGKSTAVKMLIGNHPEVSIFSINMEEITDDSMLREQLETAGKQMEQSAVWIIFIYYYLYHSFFISSILRSFHSSFLNFQ